MLFDITYTSLNFIFFVLVTMLFYFALPLKKQKWTVLLAASMFFYAVAGYRFAYYILFTSLCTYLIALWIEKVSIASKATLKSKKGEWDRNQKKAFKNRTKVQMRLIMTLALVINFGILAFLKYYDFFAGSLNDILGSFGIGFSAATLNLALPIGISFYTFQSMGYIIDVYREKTPAQKNPLKMLLFVSFFPQIIQGPISIYDQLAHQLYEPHKFDFTRVKHGMELILWGFMKKLIIADRAAIAIRTVSPTVGGEISLSNAISTYSSYSGTTLTVVILLYAIQLYADFSGGIDISRGVAQIFGIDMIDNFKRPYFSKSINEYWRRWHISLGAWLKNYLFYPIAMSGVGIWHGADWKYVAFGVWNGGIIMLSILLQPVFDIIVDKLHIRRESLWYSLFQIFRTFIVVLVGYVFDVAPSFATGMETIGKFFTDQNFVQAFDELQGLGLILPDVIVIAIATVFLFIISLIQERHADTNIRTMLDSKPFILRFILIYLGVMAVIIFGIYGSGYSAADFVYMQF